MSFTGDLEHLPIVDVVQLLHAAKKSGTLVVKGRRGESHLVFRDGYIASATHTNGRLRIGKVLLDMELLTEDELEEALIIQETAEGEHKPLLALLIEGGQIKKEDAFRALEKLVELTIVEILTWSRGTFTLDVDHLTVSDEFRYFPDHFEQEINLNTQNVLMDALRIYDEKKRDGELTEEDAREEIESPLSEVDEPGELSLISADDLGLADLDRLERKIPGVFTSLSDPDPSEVHRQKLNEFSPELPEAEREEILSFLKAPLEGVTPGVAPGRPVILFSSDGLFRHLVTAAFRKAGIHVFATDDQGDLDPIIDQSLARQALPVILFDRPDCVGSMSGKDLLALQREKREKWSRVPMLHAVAPEDCLHSLESLGAGVRAVFPRDRHNECPGTPAAKITTLLKALISYLVVLTGESNEGKVSGGLPRS